jgi:hypothetical protein
MPETTAPQPTASPRPRCDGCHYFVPTDGSLTGQCRRFPPVPLSSMHSYFPETRGGSWCGEWKPRDVSVPVQTIPAKGNKRNKE